MPWHSKWTGSVWALGNYDSSDVLDNATEVYTQMLASGWTHEAAVGAIANLCYESAGLNPGQWEGRRPQVYYGTNQGFGIAQWTPWSKVSNYVGSQAQSKMMDGAAQVSMLLSQSEQWGTSYLSASGYSTKYNLYAPYYDTFSDYSQGTSSVEEMTTAYMICWEKPAFSAGHDSITQRQIYATYFDEKLGGGTSKHYVTIQVEGNGSAYASPTSGESGTEVTLHYEEIGDDTFEEWQVISGSITIVDDKFVIGDSNVVIKAVFTGETPEPTGYHTIVVKVQVGNTVRADSTIAYSVPVLAKSGKTITLEADKSYKGAIFVKWISNDVVIEQSSSYETTFTMPDKDVIILAKYKKSMPVWMQMRPRWAW